VAIIHIKSVEGACWESSAVTSEQHDDKLELTGVRRQKILGFGNCFNELSWDTLSGLPETTRNEFLNELYGEDGCRFNSGRVPIGANDYSLEWYSCDDVRDDFSLEHFNIERDKKYTIPFVKEALSRQKDFSLFASPWSPPIWMKTKMAYNYGRFKMEEPYLKAYAQYFVKFIKAYGEQGVTVDQVHPQNEPMADQKFPSCLWSGEDMLVFIRDYLGPAIKSDAPNTELWLGTINGPFSDYRDMPGFCSPFSEFFDQWTNTILSDAQARSYISGVGLQWGGKHQLSQISAAYPDLRIMQTESECGAGTNTWEQMEYIWGLMWQYFKYGTERYIYWNCILPKNGESTWGWQQNSLATSEDGKIQYNPEFYLIKHFSHFVDPNATYVEVKGSWSANTIAFENPDGSIVLIVCSSMNRERVFSFSHQKGSFSAVIEPHSLHTFVIR